MVVSLAMKTNKKNQLYCKIGASIGNVRRKKGLNQAQLAEKVGLTTTYMGFLEQGHRVASVDVLAAIAKTLKVNLRDFFKGL